MPEPRRLSIEERRTLAEEALGIYEPWHDPAAIAITSLARALLDTLDELVCRHGKPRAEHCRECALQGFCDCKECADHA